MPEMNRPTIEQPATARQYTELSGSEAIAAAEVE